jgi:hypothetical protein
LFSQRVIARDSYGAFFIYGVSNKCAIAVQYWRSLVRVITRERNIHYVIQVSQAWGKRLILRSIIFCKSVGCVEMARVSGKQENKKKNEASERSEPIITFLKGAAFGLIIYFLTFFLQMAKDG